MDFLTKKKKVNEGEIPQYYIKHSHESIIDPEEFDRVQTEIARRKRLGKQYSGNAVLASRIICGDCGAFYGSKVWSSNTPYKKTIWQCNNKFKGENRCRTPHFNEEEVKLRLIRAINLLTADKEALLDDCRLIQETLTDCTELEAKLVEMLAELEVVTELTRKLVSENASSSQNQAEYADHYNTLVDRYEKAKARAEKLQKLIVERQAKADAIGAFIFEVHEIGPVLEFDETLWFKLIDHVTAYHDGRLVFSFSNGSDIEA